jgi:hypothetical protein
MLLTQPPEEPLVDPTAALLVVDASNGFNELGHKDVLWTIRHHWTGGSQFAFNCYQHVAQLILHKCGSPVRCYSAKR